MPTPIYYFAYGLHISRPVFQALFPSHQVYGWAWLEDFHLLFNGGDAPPAQANIQPLPGQKVEGLLYEMLPAALAVLDQAYLGYQRELRPVFIPGLNQSWPAWVYSTQKTQTAPPALHEVYKLFSAARIIPGYSPQALRRLEVLLAELKPSYT